jgi:hypothetical protein
VVGAGAVFAVCGLALKIEEFHTLLGAVKRRMRALG